MNLILRQYSIPSLIEMLRFLFLRSAKIAKELDKEFYSINAGKLITPFQGSASSALSMLFEYIERSLCWNLLGSR